MLAAPFSLGLCRSSSLSGYGVLHLSLSIPCHSSTLSLLIHPLPGVGTLCSCPSIQTVGRLKKLVDLHHGRRVDVSGSGKWVCVNDHPQGLAFVSDLTAKKIVKQVGWLVVLLLLSLLISSLFSNSRGFGPTTGLAMGKCIC